MEPESRHVAAAHNPSFHRIVRLLVCWNVYLYNGADQAVSLCYKAIEIKISILPSEKMQPPLPSPTSTWHNDTYASISPQRPELGAAGKTVVITAESAERRLSPSPAPKPPRVILLGRSSASLDETAKLLPSTVSVSTFAVDVTEEKSISDAAASIGTWDVLVLAAGYISTPSPIASADTQDWWQSFETNTKGTFLATKAFLPTANPTHATVLGVVSGMIAATVHPGMVVTSIFNKSGAKAEAFPVDTVQLPAHFLVWMSSPEAGFLKGRCVWANWDVDELKASAQTIQSGIQMTGGINGWPFSKI
ncbi:hypothetical protein AAE478_009007 [Parahypoxylon ruwenzoriense]